MEGETSYRDADNDLLYSSDSPYTSTGINKKVSPDTNITTVKRFYATVRSFPDGVRNCYTLAPVLRGAKYRVTGEFFYGNYDGLNRSPTFDLYLDVNLWTTVQAGIFTRKEIITVAAADSIQVCLVDTGKGKPFISELDLRPLPFTAYDMVNDSSSSILFNTDRKNYGAQRQIRYSPVLSLSLQPSPSLPFTPANIQLPLTLCAGSQMTFTIGDGILRRSG